MVGGPHGHTPRELLRALGRSLHGPFLQPDRADGDRRRARDRAAETPCELAGLSPDAVLPADTHLDGVSLVPVLAGAPGGRETVWTEIFDPAPPAGDPFDRRMIRDDRYNSHR